MIKSKFNNFRIYNRNFSHTLIYKIASLFLLILVSVFSFWGLYRWLLLKIQEPISILTFIGGLIGAFILKIAFDIYKRPILKIESWNDNNDETYKWKSGSHIHYKVRITNNSSFLAKKCQIKITLKFAKEDIEEYSVMCSGDNKPRIVNEKEYSKIESEHILWDVSPNGEQAFEIDIPPKSSYLSTISRYYSNIRFPEFYGDYFQIKSEDPDIPRVYLAPNKEYVCIIQVFGENFLPLTEEVKLSYTK